MKQTTLVFARQEKLAVTNIALLTLCSETTDQNILFERFEDAVTEWVETTEAGKELWIGSCRDLNIGDLSSGEAFKDPNFMRLLSQRDIKFISLLSVGCDEAIDYDYVLASPDENGWDEE